ncbi:MAG TPA: DUF2252 family protein [Methylibium sp.]
MDIVRTIRDFNQGRDPERLLLKFRNMRRSPFVFLRGTCHLFHAKLPNEKVMSKAPPSWVCGDLHLENFGSYKGDNRLVYFDLNDFDEAALAPVTWELLRVLTSILVGAETLRVTQAESLSLCEAFLDAYCAALSKGKARWVERETAHGLVGELLDRLQGRLRPQFLDSRTDRKGRRRKIRIDGKRALAVTDEQRHRVVTRVDEFAAMQEHPAFYEVLDVARRIAGNGSLGVDRYAILVRGKGSPDGNYLLDLKQALPSSLVPQLRARLPKLKQPDWKSEAQRVVTLQRRMQAVSMAFLQPLRMGRQSYVLRALQPTEDRVVLDGAAQSLAQLKGVMQVMGECAAWAQLRSAGREGSAIADEWVAFGERSKKWRRELMALARDCAAGVEADWKNYSAAYDEGAFKI